MERVKFLAIDDNSDNLIVLKAILNEAFPRATFIGAQSGKKGIELCHSEKPDVILLDIVMPEMDGYEVCKNLKADEATKTIPIIMMTAAQTDKESRIKALEFGADAFLEKPVDESELMAQIRAMVRIKESEDRKLDEKERLEALVSERTLQVENELKERKRTEDLLRVSEDKFKYIFDYSSVGKSITLTSGEINVNRVFYNILGYTQEELQHTKWQEITHPDDIDLTQRAIDSLLSGEQESARFVKRFIHKSGDIVWADLSTSLRRDKDNKPLYFMTSIIDITERKQAEERLRESEMRLRSTFDQSPVGSVIVGLDNRFIRCNSAFCHFLGYSEDELIGKTYSDITWTDDMELGMMDIKLIREGKKETSTFQKRYLRKDGIIVWGEVSISLVRYADNKLLYFLTIIQDITEWKLADAKLRESESQFRELWGATVEGITIQDKGIIVEVNDAMCRMFGYDRDQVIGRSMLDFVPEEMQDQIRDRIASSATGRFETPALRADGTRIIIEVFSNQFTYQGKFVRMVSTHNITDRKQAEEALRESEHLFRGLFNVSPNAINLIDPHDPNISWPIVDCNEATCQMNGYTREELIGHSIDVINPAEGIHEERIAFYNNLKQEGVVHKEVIHRHKDGHFFPVEVSTSIVTLGGKELILGIDRDITERKLAEEKLQKSYDLLNNLTAQVPGVVYQYRLYPDGRSAFPYSSPGMYDIYEVTPEEVREDASPIFTRIHPDDFDFIVESINESARNQTLYHSEFRVILPEQGLRWRLCDAKPELLEDGSTLWYGIISDITERKLAEEALKDSNEFNQSLLKTIPFGMNIVDEKGNILFQSENFQKIFGKEAIGRKCWELYRDERMQCDDCPLDKGIEIGETGTNETAGVLGGKVFEISHTGMVFRGKKAMLEIFHDITERKRAEIALKESEDRYRGFISQVSEGVYRFESDEPMDLSLSLEEQVDFIYDHMFIVECNDALLKMYGFSDQKEMIGKSHMDFHGGRHNPVNRDLLHKFVSNGYSIENGITEEFGSTGQLAYFSNNSVGIIENNHLIRTWGTQIDITEKIKSDQLQQVLYTISNAALSSKDLPELLEVISLQVEKLLDSTNFFIAFYDEASGMLSTHYEKDEKDEINIWPADKSATGYVIKHQKSLLASEDDIKKLCNAGELEIVGTPSKVWLGVPLWVNKKIIGAIVVQSYDNPDAYTKKDQLMLEFISRQISISIERKKAEQEIKEALVKAQESDRLKSAFLANMSHEIRTPLNSIIGFSELLLDPDFEPDQHNEFIRMISASGNNLLAIINDIMDISRIESGLVSLTISVFSVQKFIGDIQKEYSFKAGEKEIELRLDPSNPSDELYLESDEPKLKQILINFVGNAIKFTEKGFIEIGFRIIGNMAEFHVKDSGIGIPKEYHETIFERFRQVDSSYTRKYGGNGLGLAISKSLTELLGGKIWMESETGEGATFFITIPIRFINSG